MSQIEYFQNVLNSDFISSNSFLEEPDVEMRVNVDKTGCTSLIFKFDRQLGKTYKGGMFPFFNRGESGVCKVCDYIIFSEKAGQLYALSIELKKGSESTNPQLEAGVCFSDYTLATVNRVHKKNFSIVNRKISIKEFNRKGKTKLKEVEYNEHNIHAFSEKTLRLQAFLK
ncbi:MAG: hypothetical protein Q7J34_14150 [Bacteroidales bacterium]|nr:hypothetical protein [Bacteroidales bacterium]